MPTRRAIAGLCLLLTACGDWKADPEALTARSVAPAQGMACDACHAYPLTDRNHDYHLHTAEANRELNGRITCLDCHSRSIQSQVVVVIDSLFQDTATGESFYTSRHPGALDTNGAGQVIRRLTLIRVDTVRQNHPLPQPARPGAKPAFQEYVTSLAHYNGTVDVHFDPQDSDPARFGGDSASFNPERETCSAVACHPGGGPYRWEARSKGLPELNGEDRP